MVNNMNNGLNMIIFLIIIFLKDTFGLYRFVNIDNNITLLFNTENNQRSIFYCNNENKDTITGCKNANLWNELDIYDNISLTYNDEDFNSIYNQLYNQEYKIKACILYTSSFLNLGYSYQIELSRLKVIQDFGYLIDYVYDVTAVNLLQEVDNLVNAGYNYIIGTSADHLGIYNIYMNYSNVSFMVLQFPPYMNKIVNETRGSIYFYSFDFFWQIRYISGILAGLYTKTKEICFIAPSLVTSRIQQINYFYIGLIEIDPSIKLYVYPINTFSNATLELYALNKCLKEHPNVDMVAYHTDGYIIPETASSLGLKVIGYTLAGRTLYGENVLASIQINWYNILYDFFKKVKYGNLINKELNIYKIANNGFILNEYSKLVKNEDLKFINEIEYKISSNSYNNFTCSPSINYLCQYLLMPNNSFYCNINNNNTFNIFSSYCLNFLSTKFALMNNSNYYVYPYVDIPPVITSYIYVDISIMSWISITFLILNIIIIIYFTLPIIYLIFLGIKDYTKMKSLKGDFLILSFSGANLLVLGNLVIYGYPSALKCKAQIALLSIGFYLFYLPFFTQISRIFIIKQVTKDRDIIIQNYKLHLFTLLIIIFEIIYLLVWFNVAPLTIKQTLISNTTEEIDYYLDCGYDDSDSSVGNIFLLISVFIKTIVALICWILSDLVSSIGDKMLGWDKERKKKFKMITNASELKITVVLTFIILDILSICLLIIAVNVITKFIAINITIYVFIIACTFKIMVNLIKSIGKKKINSTTTGTFGSDSNTKELTLSQIKNNTND